MPRSGSVRHRCGGRCRTRSRCRPPSEWPRQQATPETRRTESMATGAAACAWSRSESEILPRRHPLDGSTAGGLLALRHEHPEEDDALALLAGDLGPVVGVGGVRQVLVLLVLLADR